MPIVLIQVHIISSKEDQKQILESCHNDPTSRQMGTKEPLLAILTGILDIGIAKDVYHL